MRAVFAVLVLIIHVWLGCCQSAFFATKSYSFVQFVYLEGINSFPLTCFPLEEKIGLLYPHYFYRNVVMLLYFLPDFVHAGTE